MLTVNGLVGIMAQPHMLATVGTGRDERTCRIGMLFGNFVKRVCTVGWMLVGLIVAAIVAQDGARRPRCWPIPRMRSVLRAGSCCSRAPLVCWSRRFWPRACRRAPRTWSHVGALFTEGLYRPHLAPNRSDRHYLWVGRISGVALTMFGVLYAMFLIQSVLYTFLLTETLATFVGISLLGGIVWPRANRWGALASLLTALAVNFLLYYLAGERLDRWDPNVFLAALLAGIGALVIVSLLTSPEPAERTESFFERLHTSSDEPGAVARPLLLVNVLRPGRAAAGRGWRVFREDLGGLAVGFGMVAALVAATAWLLS